MTAVKIPYDQLSSEALQGVIEEFVTRDGTDYGEVEVSLETKIAQVLGQLKSGKAVIVFDQGSETCTILKSDDSVLNGIDACRM
ncbi:MAG: YheU family protein [Proteobacteria bacterium]|nr:YheU family protein [Pseudomonadota bacterium]MBU1695421.1 YheU family protein [Pseudomonadota bacterium]